MAFCDLFKNTKVQTIVEWRAEHLPHGQPRQSRPKSQPPDYTLGVLICPCGGSILFIEKETPANADSDRV